MKKSFVSAVFRFSFMGKYFIFTWMPEDDRYYVKVWNGKKSEFVTDRKPSLKSCLQIIKNNFGTGEV